MCSAPLGQPAVQVTSTKDGYSQSLVPRLLSGERFEDVVLFFQIVDVRDAALAHIRAAETPSAKVGSPLRVNSYVLNDSYLQNGDRSSHTSTTCVLELGLGSVSFQHQHLLGRSAQSQ